MSYNVLKLAGSASERWRKFELVFSTSSLPRLDSGDFVAFRKPPCKVLVWPRPVSWVFNSREHFATGQKAGIRQFLIARIRFFFENCSFSNTQTCGFWGGPSATCDFELKIDPILCDFVHFFMQNIGVNRSIRAAEIINFQRGSEAFM